MSQISKALKKIEESRQDQEQKAADIACPTEVPQAAPASIPMALLAAGTTIAAILISIAALTLSLKNSESKQIQISGLEKTINSQEKTINNQEKRINDFIMAINKNQKFTESQTRDLYLRLKEESLDVDSKINILTSTDSTRYADLKDAISDEKQKIGSLEKYTKTLDQKIEAMSVTDSQVKDPATPVSGN